MQPARRFALLCMALATPGPALADDFCAAIAAFGEAPFARDAQGVQRIRSVELLWRDTWGIFTNMGYECRHHGDAAGRALCATLTAHMPQEFRTRLVFRILRCYGYAFPADVDSRWGEWSAQIGLGLLQNSELRLDVSMYQQDGSRDAIRIVSLPDDYDSPETPLPSLREPIPPPTGD